MSKKSCPIVRAVPTWTWLFGHTVFEGKVDMALTYRCPLGIQTCSFKPELNFPDGFYAGPNKK